MYMGHSSFGDTMKGIFYLILILVIIVLIAKFYGFRQFFGDLFGFIKEIFRGIF